MAFKREDLDKFVRSKLSIGQPEALGLTGTEEPLPLDPMKQRLQEALRRPRDRTGLMPPLSTNGTSPRV